VFNIADASISLGVLCILLFQKRFFREEESANHPTVETSSTVNDEVQIS
jgi:signal peptidase II